MNPSDIADYISEAEFERLHCYVSKFDDYSYSQDFFQSWIVWYARGFGSCWVG